MIIYMVNLFFCVLRITMPSLEKATKTSRDLIRHCRLVYRKTTKSPTNAVSTEELQNLKQISRSWCKSQLVLVDEVWRWLSPWTSLLEPVFALKKFHADPGYMQNALSNQWVCLMIFLFDDFFFLTFILILCVILHRSSNSTIFMI